MNRLLQIDIVDQPDVIDVDGDQDFHARLELFRRGEIALVDGFQVLQLNVDGAVFPRGQDFLADALKCGFGWERAGRLLRHLMSPVQDLG